MKKYETIELDIEKEIEQIMFDRERLIILNKIKVEILNFVKENLIGKRVNQYKKYTQLISEYFENHKDIESIEYRKRDYDRNPNNHTIEVCFKVNKELQDKYKFHWDDLSFQIHSFYHDKNEYIEQEKIDKLIRDRSGVKQFTKQELQERFEDLFSKIDQVNQLVKSMNTSIGNVNYQSLCSWEKEKKIYKKWKLW